MSDNSNTAVQRAPDVLEVQGRRPAYNAQPGYPLSQGRLAAGFKAFAHRLLERGAKVWLIDGMVGVDWGTVRAGLQAALAGHNAAFRDVQGPGGFAIDRAAGNVELVLCIGQGSAMLPVKAARACVWSAGILPAPGAAAIGRNPWAGGTPALHSCQDLYVDMSDPANPVLIEGAALRATLAAMSRRPFRVKPVFYSTVWGGQWLKQRLSLDQDRPNCGGSYEFLASENSVLLQDHGLRIEVPFDLLMAQEAVNIQGAELTERFSTEFPIRLNLTDTIQGGDLSCQVHPLPDYAWREFGHRYPEHETYYVLAADKGAQINLGLREGLDPGAFRHVAECARDAGVAFDTGQYVNAWPSHAHDVFHVPAGTVHNIGAGNLVLEIISSSLMHTLRIYDHLRTDSRGRRRQVHIQQAWDNIDFCRQTRWVRENLIPSPRMVRCGEGWTEIAFGGLPFLPYAVHRADFEHVFTDDTGGERFHLLHMVEGEEALVEWDGGNHLLHFAETLLVPAATGPYRLHNQARGVCKVLKVYVW